LKSGQWRVKPVFHRQCQWHAAATTSNKLFRDNSHLKAGFEDYGAVGEKGGGLEQKGGTLSVKAVANGPLMLSGNFAIGAGSRRIAWQGNQAGFEAE